MAFTQHLIKSVWQRHSFWSRLGWALLVPLSFLFSLVVRGRNWLYDRKVLPITQLPLDVISVGNITVGGTGKTPMVLGLAHTLQQRGYRVGIITRGYGGTTKGPTLVGKDGTPLVTPTEVGDEAVLLARRFIGVVMVGRDRVAAARHAHQQFALDVVILDDGFQHRRLHRDVDILLFSAQGAANTSLLPAGPFREPFSSMQRAHAIVLSKGEEAKEQLLSSVLPDDTQHVSRNTYHATRNTQHAIRNTPPQIPMFRADLLPTSLVQVVHGEWHELPLSTLAGKRMFVVSGIANPQPFYRTIQQHGAALAQVVEFPDHHSYTHTEWQKLACDSRAYDGLLTTEKDLVKLEHFVSAPDRLFALRVEFQVEPVDLFVQTIEQRLRAHKKDRTDHGRTISH